jgi:N-acetylmuramoyl-L-alanine amidase
MARIIVDAGHGGSAHAGNSSPLGSRGPSGLLEKDVTLDIARHVVSQLGGDAAITRVGDSNLPLRARAERASRDGAEVFVSIHANSGPPGMSGAETWIHADAGPDSRRLAGGIQHALERLEGRYGGAAPARRAPMAVLSPSVLGRRTAACLVEVDYLTSTRGEHRLGQPGERAAIGGAIAGAIREHLRGRPARVLEDAPVLEHEPPHASPPPSPASYSTINLLWELDRAADRSRINELLRELDTRQFEVRLKVKELTDTGDAAIPPKDEIVVRASDNSENVRYSKMAELGVGEQDVFPFDFRDFDPFAPIHIQILERDRAGTIASAAEDVIYEFDWEPRAGSRTGPDPDARQNYEYEVTFPNRP